MRSGDLIWIANYIWGIADDVLRDLYVHGKYRDVILPMTVLRRLDAVLEGSKHRFYNTGIATYNVGTRKVEAREAADRLPANLVTAKAEESVHEYTIEEEVTVWWTGALAQQWNEAPRRSAELGHSPEHEYRCTPCSRISPAGPRSTNSWSVSGRR